jgi:formylmethanofuran dehydrogenase subunit E
MIRELWEKSVAFHGHECPGLAIGVKACEGAMEKMELGRSEDEEIVCITENDACGVDAIQVIFSCTIGKGNLIYRNTGKQAFSFFDRKTGKKLRLYLKATNNDLEREEFMEYLLNSPLEEIFEFSQPSYQIPEKAKIFATVECSKCGESASEHSMRLEGGKPVCADCYINYHRGW